MENQQDQQDDFLDIHEPTFILDELDRWAEEANTRLRPVHIQPTG